eukprot:m.265493 g.265493  ORF g.265493 m.265493 type:complete len:174 (-) comp62021_c0_seq1:125-646(-)
MQNLPPDRRQAPPQSDRCPRCKWARCHCPNPMWGPFFGIKWNEPPPDLATALAWIQKMEDEASEDEASEDENDVRVDEADEEQPEQVDGSRAPPLSSNTQGGGTSTGTSEEDADVLQRLLQLYKRRKEFNKQRQAGLPRKSTSLAGCIAVLHLDPQLETQLATAWAEITREES